MTDWQPIPGWEGIYDVSRDGRVRKSSGDEIGMWLNDQGYYLVRLSGPDRRKQCRVHRLVAAAFCRNGDGHEVVNHIDHNRQNNDASNLEWCSQGHNLRHARVAGRMKNYWDGKRSPNAALCDEEVRAINRRRKEGLSYMRIAEEFGVSKRTIGRILSGEYYAEVA